MLFHPEICYQPEIEGVEAKSEYPFTTFPIWLPQTGEYIRSGKCPKCYIHSGKNTYVAAKIRGEDLALHTHIGNHFIEACDLDLAENIVVDHIDEDQGNNSIYNLQFITQSENVAKGAIIRRRKINDPGVEKCSKNCYRVERSINGERLTYYHQTMAAAVADAAILDQELLDYIDEVAIRFIDLFFDYKLYENLIRLD